MSKAYTMEEVQEKFLNYLHALVDYWDKVNSRNSKEKMEGLIHSILVTFDGTSIEFPALDIVLRPHPDDKDYHIGNHEQWFEDGMCINDDVYLHDMWYHNQKTLPTESENLNSLSYHYLGSGLLNVWLSSGYAHIDTIDYGNATSIIEVEQLNVLISECLVDLPRLLVGIEICFLRKELGLSQEILEKYTGYTVKYIDSLEKSLFSTSPAIDKIIRMLVLEKANPNFSMRDILNTLPEIKNDHDLTERDMGHFVFGYIDGKWRLETNE